MAAARSSSAQNSSPKHIKNLLENGEEVLRLVAIHEQLTGTGPGRRHNVQILNKTAIVLLIATWEAFVEDLAEGALQFLIHNATDHNAFPRNVLEIIGASRGGLKAWDLAGEGWKQVLRDNFKEIVNRTIRSFNSPKTTQVNDLFEKTIGLVKISSSWRWQGAKSEMTSKKLDELVSLRGEIAHRVKATREVHKGDVRNAEDLIVRICTASSNAVRAHVEQRVGKAPWVSI